MDTISELRLDFMKDAGLIISDKNFFAQTIQKYGYHEIIYQYGERFVLESDDDFKFQPGTTYERIYDYYWLDQHLKNQMMISLQLFEQNFKVVLTEISLVGQLVHAAENMDTQGEIKSQFLQEEYRLANGRVIRRGDVKARIRHIRKNYLEPYSDYRKIHGEADPWVLFKEMSFGVATNYFFLMPAKMQKQVLAKIFKNKMTVHQFDKWLETVRYFQRRAAHNYRLIGIKEKETYLYQEVLSNLQELKNEEPYQLVKKKWQEIIEQYLQKYPNDKEFLQENLF
ncbi:Abi family protein [Lactobacillus xujianguonis]|uniref:Abi family protein n=2 Tax=Lactobacillaceae TaxID=33958 RepID=A0A437SW77_9LACO|nr:Abi family protein [Lactobacillus xujianguonis]RVU77525.1 Abi family protein [Lactobacillus xujianguonis]